MSRCYEFKQFYKKPGRKTNTSNAHKSYLDYLRKSDYPQVVKEVWERQYKLYGTRDFLDSH